MVSGSSYGSCIFRLGLCKRKNEALDNSAYSRATFLAMSKSRRSSFRQKNREMIDQLEIGVEYYLHNVNFEFTERSGIHYLLNVEDGFAVLKRLQDVGFSLGCSACASVSTT